MQIMKLSIEGNLLDQYLCQMYFIRYYVAYIQHQLTANSRHGTHSPFVYRLVDEVIYAKRKTDEPEDKVKRLIARLIDRFQAKRVHRLGERLSEERLDFMIVPANNAATLSHQLKQGWPNLHSGSVVVLQGIYSNQGMRQLWQSIKERQEVTVTIDLFHVGLVFLHEGQAKEDFRISF